MAFLLPACANHKGFDTLKLPCASRRSTLRTSIGRVAVLRKCKFFHLLTRTRPNFGSFSSKTDATSPHVVGTFTLEFSTMLFRTTFTSWEPQARPINTDLNAIGQEYPQEYWQSLRQKAHSHTRYPKLKLVYWANAHIPVLVAKLLFQWDFPNRGQRSCLRGNAQRRESSGIQAIVLQPPMVIGLSPAMDVPLCSNVLSCSVIASGRDQLVWSPASKGRPTKGICLMYNCINFCRCGLLSCSAS